MIKFFGFLFKTTLFILFILILGNWVKWDGKTLNGHIQSHIAKVEKSPNFRKAAGWSEDTLKEVSKSAKGIAKDVTSSTSSDSGSHASPHPSAFQQAKDAADGMRKHNDGLNRSLSDEGSETTVSGRHGLRQENRPGYDDSIHEKRAHPLPPAGSGGKENAPVTDIPSSERQKLKALIRDLNGSTQTH